MTYALVADQFRQGHGFNVPLLSSEGFPALFTFQPPLYPLMLAALGAIHPGNLLAGQSINVASHVVIALCAMLFVARLAGCSAGGLAGLLTAMGLGLLQVSNMIWSEASFIASMMLVLVLLQSARYSGHPWRWRLAASIMAAVNVGIRYAGVGFLPVLLWETLIVGRRLGWRRGLLTGVTLLALPTTVLGGLWGRNYVLTGTIRGMPASNSQHDALGTLGSIVTHILPEAGLSGSFRAIALVLILLPVVLWIIHRWRSATATAAREGAGPGIWAGGLDLPIVALAAYAVSLAVAVSRYQPKLEIRFVTPLAPLAMVTLATLMCACWRLLRDSSAPRPAEIARWAYFSSLVALLTVTALGTLKHFEPARTKASLADSRLLTYLRRNIPPGTPVATNVPPGLAFYGGYRGMYLQNSDFYVSATISSPFHDPLSPVMLRAGAQYAAFFCDPKGLKPEQWGTLVADLSCGKSASRNFVLIYRGPDGIVYKLRQPTTAPAVARR